MRSVLVAGVGRERRFPLDLLEVSDSPLSPLEDLLGSSRDGGRDDVNEVPEFLRSADDGFWVSMAAGGFLLRRFAALISSAFFRLSFSFFALSSCFFSFFFFVAPNSDQLGERHISGSSLNSSSTAVATVELFEAERSKFDGFVSANSIGAV